MVETCRPLSQETWIWGTWVAQAKRLSAVGSDHDLRVLGLSPVSDSLLRGKPASPSASAQALSLFLYEEGRKEELKKKKKKTLKKKKNLSYGPTEEIDNLPFVSRKIT